MVFIAMYSINKNLIILLFIAHQQHNKPQFTSMTDTAETKLIGTCFIYS